MISPCLHYDCDFRNNAGYCKISACVNPKYNNQLINTNVSKMPQTNGDRIRSMSDEELADEYIRIYSELPKYSDSWAWLRGWLKQEVDGEQT